MHLAFTILLIQIPYLINSEHQNWDSRTTRYGLRTFSYVGSHLWNFVLNDYSDIAQIDFDDFKAFLNTWKGPDILQHAISLLWWPPILYKHFSYVFRCATGLFYPSLHVFVFYPATVHLVTALYIFAPYSRILAFWLMLFVYNATWNKALSYLILSYKNIVRYTAHTIASWPNPKQWLSYLILSYLKSFGNSPVITGMLTKACCGANDDDMPRKIMFSTITFMLHLANNYQKCHLNL